MQGISPRRLGSASGGKRGKIEGVLTNGLAPGVCGALKRGEVCVRRKEMKTSIGFGLSLSTA